MASINRNLCWLLLIGKAARMWQVMCKLVLDCIWAESSTVGGRSFETRLMTMYCSDMFERSPKNVFWSHGWLFYYGPLSCLLGVFTWSWQNKMLVSDVIPRLLLSHKMATCHLRLKGVFFHFLSSVFLNKALMWPDLLSIWKQCHLLLHLVLSSWNTDCAMQMHVSLDFCFSL